MRRSARFIAVALCALALLAQPPRSLAADAIRSFRVPGRPFAVAVSPDGATLFVSVSGTSGERGGIRVFHLAGDQVANGTFVALEGEPHGIALMPDGTTLLVANGTGLAELDARALARDEQSVPAYLRDSLAGSIEVAPSRDGTYAFVSNESRGDMSVVRLARASDGSTQLSLLGKVPTGRLPVGIALSADGALLYVASEIARPRADFANAGDSQAVRDRCAENGTRNGTLTVIDTEKAQAADPGAVVATFAAGCAPVRVVLSPKGDFAWVTARGENRLLAFDTQKMHADPQHALAASVPVGSAPVGLAVVDDGALVVVANSDRFAKAAKSTMDVVDTAKALAHADAVQKSLPTGAFPREFAEAPNHATLYLTNFRSDAVEIVDESALR